MGLAVNKELYHLPDRGRLDSCGGDKPAPTHWGYTKCHIVDGDTVG